MSFNEQIDFMVKELVKLEADSHFHSKTAKDCERQADLIRGDIKSLMQREGVIMTIAGDYSLRIKNNPPSVVIPDADAVPDEYCKVKKEPKKAEIKKLLEDKKVNWATLSEPSTNLTIARAE